MAKISFFPAKFWEKAKETVNKWFKAQLYVFLFCAESSFYFVLSFSLVGVESANLVVALATKLQVKITDLCVLNLEKESGTCDRAFCEKSIFWNEVVLWFGVPERSIFSIVGGGLELFTIEAVCSVKSCQIFKIKFRCSSRSHEKKRSLRTLLLLCVSFL